MIHKPRMPYSKSSVKLLCSPQLFFVISPYTSIIKAIFPLQRWPNLYKSTMILWVGKTRLLTIIFVTVGSTKITGKENWRPFKGRQRQRQKMQRDITSTFMTTRLVSAGTVIHVEWTACRCLMKKWWPSPLHGPTKQVPYTSISYQLVACATRVPVTAVANLRHEIMFVTCMTILKTTLASTSEWDAPTKRHPSMYRYVTCFYRHALEDTSGIEAHQVIQFFFLIKPTVSETITLFISREHLSLTSRLNTKLNSCLSSWRVAREFSTRITTVWEMSVSRNWLCYFYETSHAKLQQNGERVSLTGH